MKRQKKKLEKKKKTPNKFRKTRYEFSSGGIVHNGKKILLVKDGYGRWTTPKGHVEKGETPETAALREITEETGLKKIKIIDTLPATRYVFSDSGTLVFKKVKWFLVKAYLPKELKINHELTDAIWVDIDAALPKIDYKNLSNVFTEAIDKLRKKR